MLGKARLVGHPIHTQLIVFPVGLLFTSVAFDVLASVTHKPNGFHVAYWMIGAGEVMGLLAAAFGFLDWLSIPRGTRAHRVASFHGIGNVIMVFLFGISWFMRAGDPFNPPLWALLSSYLGALVLVFTGWAGGELVSRLGVGVHDDANVNAATSWSLFTRNKTPTIGG